MSVPMICGRLSQYFIYYPHQYLLWRQNLDNSEWFSLEAIILPYVSVVILSAEEVVIDFRSLYTCCLECNIYSALCIFLSWAPL